jgi:hypothetical protein
VLHRGVVLDRHRVEQLPTETLGEQPGADALARGVDRRGRPRGPTADDEHLERLQAIEPLRVAGRGSLVQSRHELLEGHPPLAEELAVAKDHGHRKDAALLDLTREDRAVDGDVADSRVEDAHQVERLHDVRAVLARLTEVRLEPVLPREAANGIQELRGGRGGVPAHLEQREYERGELVPERHPGELHLDVGADAHDPEGGAACGIPAAHVVIRPPDRLAISSRRSASWPEVADSSRLLTSSTGSTTLVR